MGSGHYEELWLAAVKRAEAAEEALRRGADEGETPEIQAWCRLTLDSLLAIDVDRG